jgi:hypothetical protein
VHLQAEEEQRTAEAKGADLFEYTLVNDDLHAARDALKAHPNLHLVYA